MNTKPTQAKKTQWNSPGMKKFAVESSVEDYDSPSVRTHQRNKTRENSNQTVAFKQSVEGWLLKISNTKI